VPDPIDRPRYALLIQLPRAAEIRIEETFLPLAGITKPTMGFHISLLGPFYLCADAPVSMLEHVPRACAQQPPFSVRLAGLGAFRSPDNNGVFLQIVDPKPVLALHDALLGELAPDLLLADERYRAWNVDEYEPHVTLGLSLSDKELVELLRAAQNHPFDLSFGVKEIWLAEQAPNTPWRMMQAVPLG
jgi:2'-5' RNA ligase